MKLRYLMVLLLPICLLSVSDAAQAAKGDIYIVKVADAISPGVAEFVKSSLEKAQEEEAACIIIELDTPGGLAESMRLIVQDILASKVPVVVYVSPSGARAASAGVMRCCFGPTLSEMSFGMPMSTTLSFPVRSAPGWVTWPILGKPKVAVAAA